jgi:hypothetical protein
LNVYLLPTRGEGKGASRIHRIQGRRAQVSAPDRELPLDRRPRGVPAASFPAGLVIAFVPTRGSLASGLLPRARQVSEPSPLVRLC